MTREGVHRRGIDVSGLDAETVAEALAGPGYCVFDDWLPTELWQALLAEVRADAASMAYARIGRGADSRQLETIRGDRTCWIDAGHGSAAVKYYLARIDQLRQQLNRRLFLGLDDYECHFAHYPPGAHYERHRDRFRNDDARTLSSVYYLNENWSAADGGELRLHLTDPECERVVDVMPAANRFVLFRSADIEHAVLRTRRDRYSIAGWMRRSGV